MEDKNCELLFEYLRSILYDSKVKTLDIKELDEPYQKLGMGLQFLEHAVVEMKESSESLSKGQLSVSVPDRDNFLITFYKSELSLSLLLEKLRVDDTQLPYTAYGDDTISVTRDLI